MRKIQFGLLALLLGMTVSTSSFAHDSIGFSLNIGRPYFYSPPVYYSPPPLVYFEPRPIYREYYSSSPNVYYYPGVDRYYDYNDWRGYHEHHWHHHHHYHDDDD